MTAFFVSNFIWSTGFWIPWQHNSEISLISLYYCPLSVSFLPFKFFLAICLSKEIILRSSFLISSSAGNSSGLMPLFPNSNLTSLLFLTCSEVIFPSPLRLFFFTLKLVISVANSLAVIVIVGKKSAKVCFLLYLIYVSYRWYCTLQTLPNRLYF